MARIELQDLSHSYVQMLGGGVNGTPKECVGEEGFAIRGLNLAWESGSANALLGPSGCGKTTLLNIISGLLRPTGGRVLFDGRDVTGLSPRERHIAQVFQFQVVYDTMSVFDNLAFPLLNSGVSRKEARRRVEEIAEILELRDFLSALSGRLNPAEKQKVSLGRGIVREDTAAILLDEPLTVIDPKAKYVLRRKLKEVQRKLKITMTYVTHDQHEALTFADFVTVMKDGRVIQTGTPEQLHSDPASPFIGYFIGTPGMNFIDCTLTEKGLDFGDFSMVISDAIRSRLGGQGGRFRLGIRPECVEASKGAKEGWVPLAVNVLENVGIYKILTLTSDGILIKSRVPEDMVVSEGDRVWVNFPEDKLKIFKDDKKIY